MTIWGKVRHGEYIGKRLGFPTANIRLHKKIPEGIYLSKTKIKGLVHPSLTFVGSAKTFDSQKYQAETFILQFDKNIYNQWVSVHLVKKIRDNKKFGSKKELIAQMKLDLKRAEKFFAFE